MFGRRRRGWGGGGGDIGLFLLFFQVMNFFRSTNEFLPVTFGVLGVNVIAFLRPDINLGSNRIHWPSVTSSCISVQTVYYCNVHSISEHKNSFLKIMQQYLYRT